MNEIVPTGAVALSLITHALSARWRGLLTALLALKSFAAALILLVLVSSCAPAATSATPTPTLAGSATPSPTKPVSTQASLPAPTHVRWAVDKGSVDDPARPYLLELLYDGTAMGFRVIDASGRLVLQFPIAGSGIFGPETCLVSARPPGKSENATWRSIDEATYREFAANASTYRVEADKVGGGVVTLQLEDSGCHRI